MTPGASVRRYSKLVFFVLVTIFLMATWRHIPSPQSVLRIRAATEKGFSCHPAVTRTTLRRVESLRQSCRRASSESSSSPPFNRSDAKIATLTVSYGASNQPYYDDTIQTHLQHTLLHRRPLRVMCSPLVDELYNKEAFLLANLFAELDKPPESRLDWFFWADRDSIILDYCRDLLDFLPSDEFQTSSPSLQQDSTPPPPSGDARANLIVTNDFNGLNNGVFFIRVSQWSINFISDVLAFPHLRPEVELRFTEQSAMENILQQDRYKDNVVFVPQHWFNAMTLTPDAADDFATRQDPSDLPDWAVRRGDFLVHFAGHPDKNTSVAIWSDAARRAGNVWAEGTALRDASAEINEFWGNLPTSLQGKDSLQKSGDLKGIRKMMKWHFW